MFKTKRFYAMILVLLFSIANILQTNVLDVFAADDVIGKVQISGVNLALDKAGNKIDLIKNGVSIDPQAEVKVGDVLVLKYYWEIPDTTGINAGDFFKIKLPAQSHLAYQETVGTINNGFGDFKIVDQNGEKYAIFTLNAFAVSNPRINNGYFICTGAANKEGQDVEISGGNTIDISPGSGDPSGGSGGNDGGEAEFPSWKLPFSKTGKVYYAHEVASDPSKAGKIFWNVQFNYEGLNDLLKTGESVEEKSGLVLVDTLPPGLELVEDSVFLYTPLMVPTKDSTATDSKMSGLSLKSLKIEMGDLIKPNDGELYEDFYDRLLQKVADDGKAYLGVFENKLLLALGDFPNAALKYHDIFYAGRPNELRTFIQSNVGGGLNITQTQADLMKDYYYETGKSQGKVVALDLAFDTKMLGGYGEYTNNVKSKWQGGEEDASATVWFYADAGAEGDKVTIDLKFKKEWQDSEGNASQAPKDEIKFKLFKLVDGRREEVIVDGQYDGISLLKADSWEKLIEDLPKYEGSNLVDYYVEEQDVDADYEVKYEENIVAGVLEEKIINSEKAAAAVEKTFVKVEKEWKGLANTDAKPEVTIKLMKNAVLESTVKLNDGNAWKHTFADLDKVDANGSQIIYTVEEEAVDGFTTNISEEDDQEGGLTGKKFTVSNTKDVTAPVAEKTFVKVEKEWKGLANTDAKPEVTIKLMKNGALESSAKLNDGNSWRHSFSGLDKFDSDNNAIVYSVEEEALEGFSVKVSEASSEEAGLSGKKVTITNTKKKETEPEKRLVKVQKKWEGLEDTDTKPEVTIKLLKNGNVDSTAKLNEGNLWEYTFEDLNKFDSEGKEITYSVVEEAIAGFDTTINIEDIVENGQSALIFVVTNKKRSNVYTVDKLPDPSDPDSPDEIEIINEEGVSLGTYVKKENSEGEFEYVDEEGIPSGVLSIVQTGDDFPKELLVLISILAMFSGLALLHTTKKDEVLDETKTC